MAQFTIKRGLIRAADGDDPRREPRARRSTARRSTSAATRRAASSRTSSATRRSRARAPGSSASLNDYLTGSNTNLEHGPRDDARQAPRRDDQGQRRLADARRRGAQRVALQQLLGNAAAPSSRSSRAPGSVLVMASSPTYDPNLVEGNFGADQQHPRRLPRRPRRCVNRATDGLYVPGSTLQGRDRRGGARLAASTRSSRRFDDPGYCIEYGKQVAELRRPERPEPFGTVNFLQALAVLDQLGLLQHRQGDRRAARSSTTAKQFGFYADPPLETPGNERHAERPLQERQALRPERPGNPGRPGPPRLRPGAAARDAAADGDGRGRGRATTASSWSRTSSTGSSRPDGDVVTPHEAAKYSAAR